MLRATAPTPWAMPSQAAAIPRKTSVKNWATGPGPERTARGAGRRDAGLRLLEAGLRLELVLRDRVLEPLRPVLRVVLVLLDVDVLLLRDPGGEDVRVAMVTTLRSRHSRHTHHRSACLRARSAPLGCG